MLFVFCNSLFIESTVEVNAYSEAWTLPSESTLNFPDPKRIWGSVKSISIPEPNVLALYILEPTTVCPAT